MTVPTPPAGSMAPWCWDYTDSAVLLPSQAPQMLKAFARLQKIPITMEIPGLYGITMGCLSGKLLMAPPGALLQSGRMGDIQQGPDLATMPC